MIVLTDTFTLNHIASCCQKVLFLVCAGALLLSSARADEPSKAGGSEVKPEDVAAIPKFDFAAAAAEYEIVSGSDHLICEPVQAALLNWSNPVRSTVAGTVFLWHHKGMPQAACCMYAYRNPTAKGDYLVNHEFVSLATGLVEAKSSLVEAKSSGATAWQTKQPGIVWQDLSEGPTISKLRSGRLAQMRNVASQFTGTVGKKREELRLLRQPVYRYPETMDRDGAIFVFAQTTDPEILLLLDVDPNAIDSKWKFAVARITRLACALRQGDKEVYSAVWYSSDKDNSHCHRTLHHVPWRAIDEK